MNREANRLAHEIAYNAARELIDSHTTSESSDGATWRNLDGDWEGTPLGLFLKDELRYLTLRDALQWHRAKPNLVRIVEARS
jgi:hypothetical protein